MSDHVLFVGWNQAARGREQDAVAAFGAAVQYYGSLVERGDIESFEPFFLRPHGGDLNGFMLLRGERAKLDALQEDEEFLRVMATAMRAVDGIGFINGVTGDALAQQMAIFAELNAEG
jgi:hypothetical protein